MPTYLSPGVYVEEVEAGSRPIEGVGTAVAAFVGLAARGPTNTPTLVTNWSQFVSAFGDFTEGAYLAHAVYGYFLNGGGAAYVVRIGGDAPAATARAEIPTQKDAKLNGYRISAIESGAGGNQISVEVSEATTPGEDTFKLTVRAPGKPDEVYDELSTKRGKTNVVTVIKEQSKLITVEEVGAAAIERAPARGRVTLAGAEGSKPMRLTPDDYVGDPADRTGFGGLEAVDEVTMLAVPDLMSLYQKGVIDAEGVQAVQSAMIGHCELMGDRVAILDAPPGLNAQQVKEWRVDKVGYDSKYASLYWPWVKVLDPLTGKGAFVPPSGHVAGVWARSDANRGVHKAPANEVIRGALALELIITKGEHDQLNPNGINCIRAFPGRGHPDLGCPDAVERSVLALPERPAALQLHRGVDPGRHPVGRLRAQRHGPVAARQAHPECVPHPHLARRRALRRHSPGSLLRQVRLRDQPARCGRRRPARGGDRDRARQARRIRGVPHRAILRRRVAQRIGGTD